MCELRGFSPQGWAGLACLALLTLCAFVEGSTECKDLIDSQKDLTVKTGTTCTLNGSVDVNTFTVQGTVRVTSATHVTANVISIDVDGRLIADPVGTDGEGKGTLTGSGGWLLICDVIWETPAYRGINSVFLYPSFQYVYRST